MARFEYVGGDKAKHAENAVDYVVRDCATCYAIYILDTATNRIVFFEPEDGFEPEDSTLSRDYAPLIDLLNQVANEGINT